MIVCQLRKLWFCGKMIVIMKRITQKACKYISTTTIADKNNDTNDKFYRKVAFLMYTEMVNLRPQSLKAASELEPH